MKKNFLLQIIAKIVERIGKFIINKNIKIICSCFNTSYRSVQGQRRIQKYSRDKLHILDYTYKERKREREREGLNNITDEVYEQTKHLTGKWYRHPEKIHRMFSLFTYRVCGNISNSFRKVKRFHLADSLKYRYSISRSTYKRNEIG